MIDNGKLRAMVERCKRSDAALKAANDAQNAATESAHAAGKEYGEAHVALQEYLKQATGIPTLGTHR